MENINAAAFIPLTQAQLGIYYECVAKPEATTYNNPFALHLPESTDLARFTAAVSRVAQQHPALFATVGMREGTPVMLPGKENCAVAAFAAESLEAATAGFVRPFDLANGPLYRFAVCTLPQEKLFLFDVHHLVFDGVSLSVLMRQLATAYEGEEIPAEGLTLFSSAEKEQGLQATEQYKKAREFFRAMLEENDFDSEILLDAPRPDRNAGCAYLDMAAPAGLNAAALDEFTQRVGVSKVTVFLAAFAYTLAAFTAKSAASFTTATTGRHDALLADTIGMFVKILPLHIAFDANSTVKGYLQEVKKLYYGAAGNDCISFGELVNTYGLRDSAAFVYQSGLFASMPLEGEKPVPKGLPVNDCPNDILCMLIKTATSYRLHLQYRKGLYTAALMESFGETYFRVVQGMLACERLKDIPLVTEKARKFIDAFNRTETPSEYPATVNESIDSMVARYPANTALVYKNKSYTYAVFDRLTKALAASIAARGIGADDFVAVLAPRNDEAVLAAWGAIRAGAGYQPLDPTYPSERLDFMLADSKAKLLITTRELRSLVREYNGPVLYTDEILTLPEAPAFSVTARPEAALALIYTSGTTGTPKGCILENRNLAAFAENYAAAFAVDTDSRLASYASFGFDAGVLDVVITPTLGAALYIVPDEIRLDLAQVEEFYCANGITHGFMTTQVARMFALNTACTSLKVLLVGGEKMVPFVPPHNFRFVNSYGPCETFCYVCAHDVDSNAPLQPIGKPSRNTKLYVLDKQNRLLPPGAIGELGIAGVQVGRGYLNLPEKTAAAFIANPFDRDKTYARLYKTGDYVRLLPAGELDFVGRQDSQVKIRGFRVELTEIEEIIRRFPGIADATVVALDEANGGKYIAAYVTGPEKIDVQALNSFIRAEKPDYMVPAVTLQLEKIPYTQNQKVNKRALPLPQRTQQAEDKPIPPANETQQKIFDLAAGILGSESFGINTDLFAAGMTSIQTLQFNLELGKAFAVPVKLSDLREHSTVESLAAFLGNARSKEAYEKLKYYPLMQNQLGVFLAGGMDSATTRYNIPMLLRLDSSLDSERLRSAVCSAINAHPYVKAVLDNSNGTARLLRKDDAEPVVEIIETEKLPPQEDLVTPFTVLNSRLYRAAIYVTPEDKYLFLDIHHIVADGTSLNILLRDISAAYRGEKLTAEKFSGFEAALEEEKALASPRLDSASAYYDQLLADCSTSCLPGKCAEKEAQPNSCTQYSYSFGEISSAISSYCQENRLTANAFFNAVFSYTLAEFLHTDDVTYCTVYNGRNDSRLAECFAMLVKTLPVRCRLDYNNSPLAFVQSVQSQLLDSMANDTLSFVNISKKYGVKPDVFFNYQGDSFRFDRLGGVPATLLPLETREAKAPLSIEVFLENGVYRAEVIYRTDLLCREFVTSLTGGLRTAAEEFTKSADLAHISVLSEEEKQSYAVMNATEAPFEAVPAHVFIERQAASAPEKAAVKTLAASLTYGELNAKANAVASSLVKLGAGNGEILGLLLDRSELIPVAEIGILKAGCAFLPMLPAYPDERVDFCLRDAECRYVVTTADIAAAKQALFTEDKPYKVLLLEDLLKGETSSAPQVIISQNQPAYCIYTSGSTGTPKGVLIEQHSLANFVQTAALRELESRGNSILCMASISFDMSMTEIFFSLCQGKTIYIATEEEVHNLDKLLAAFTQNHIDLLMTTPSFAWSLLSLKEFLPALSQLQGIVLGAEAFQPGLLAKLYALNPNMLIQNGYGPTECTQVCSVKTLTSGCGITIGRPFANTKFYVTDSRSNILPRYAVGELIICGEGVCRGYVNLPEKNEAAFTEINGLRAYRSGDLVRINRDNEAEFGGRTDNQVKLRGFRIELDEIETVLQEFDGIIQSKVIVRNNGTEDFLAGYFTASQPINLEKLTAFLKGRLNYYMVPAALLQLEKMPLTPNGKPDKKALPEIRPAKKVRSRRAPRKSLEENILDVFRSVLGSGECYVDDNFFELGGTSLSASKVVMQLKSAGHRIEYQDIFDHQSAAELAEYLESSAVPTDKASPAHEQQLIPGEEKFSSILQYNTLEYAPRVKRKPLGDVLLTGATGFLGAHILKALLDTEEGHITCLIRKGCYDTVIARLQTILVYYFEDDYKEAFRNRITVLEGDITDENLSSLCKDISFDTLINCAASVKHYAKDSSIEFVNVHGVENLIALTREKNARMIQISTVSVPGAHNEETYRINLKMPENRLFVIDDMNNQYVQSKYQAELLMLEAIRNGMRGKIIRVGNLMGRYSDGEFQTNMRTNAFLNGLRGFVSIGKCPLSHATDPMSFSPVDCTAQAVVLLSGTNDMFTAFHAESRSTFDEMKVIEAINRCGIKVSPVGDEEYYADFRRMMSNPETNEKVSALLTNDRPDMHLVEADTRFTANVLYRLGFSWPFIDDAYLEKVITSLDTLNFFMD